MKFLKYVFLLFGIFELYAAYSTYIQTPETINATWGGNFITPEAMVYVRGFANGITAIGIISVLAFFAKGRMTWIAICAGFLFYNVMAAYGCSTSTHLSDRYVAGMYAHIVFSILFVLMLFLSFRNSE